MQDQDRLPHRLDRHPAEEPWRADARQIDAIIKYLKIELSRYVSEGRFDDRLEPNPLSWAEGEQIVIKLVNYRKLKLQRALLEIACIVPGFRITDTEAMRQTIKNCATELDSALRFLTGYLGEAEHAKVIQTAEFPRGWTSIEFKE